MRGYELLVDLGLLQRLLLMVVLLLDLRLWLRELILRLSRLELLCSLILWLNGSLNIGCLL